MDWKKTQTLLKDVVVEYYKQEDNYGFVVVDGNHHNTAVGSFLQYEILFNKTFLIANKHNKSASRFQLTESRHGHLRLIEERLDDSFRGENGELTNDRLVLAGPGSMKKDLLDHLKPV